MWTSPGSRPGRRFESPVMRPGGRLTLTSGSPIMPANATAQATVYYSPWLDNQIGLPYGGSFFNYVTPELSVSLDSTNFLSGKIYDFFVFGDGARCYLGYGPAWTSNTARSAGTAITRAIGGIWTNSIAVQLRGSSTTVYFSVPNQARYVGSVFCTANGQTGCSYDASASGGGLTTWSIFNADNRVLTNVRSRDTNVSWTYATSTWRALDNNANNSVRFLDGLGEVFIDGFVSAGLSWTGSSFNTEADIGLNLNSTSATPTVNAWLQVRSTTGTDATGVSFNQFLPALGFNTMNAVERAVIGATLYGGTSQATVAKILV